MTVGLAWDLLTRDRGASAGFLRLAGSMDKAAVASERMNAKQLEASRVANRVKIAQLEVAAATERRATVANTASASVARQARAEIALIRANEGLASSQAAAAAMAAKQSKANQVAATTAAVASQMTKGITLPLVAITLLGAKNAIEYQKQQALLRTAAGETEQNMRQITGGIKQVSSDTATSLHELYEGMYVVAKAAKSRGWTGAEQLNILRAAAQGAKAEMVPMATAVDALSTVMTDYHSKASDAVHIENQLIKASGLAKTNFGLFSESLSNVTPIAAALGISFAEVGGSIATMTQHGVTAQRATENLRNLLFNLSGQNNVASQAMQQLGIDTVDLAKNLGTRGLTGTLKIVDDAMKAHTKNGMVVIDVAKASALAQKSLQTEIGSMPKRLQEQSRGLLAGSVNIKEYQQSAKGMGGTAGAMGLQYLALYKNALGFSNQLRSGKGTITTSVAQYRQLLGGMTGAAVAMQIAGKYAKDNEKNVRAVGDAAEHTGKNVHGWELTQKTLAYKLDDAGNKASLFATALGEKALPVLGKLADWGVKAFKWVDGLDSSDKKVLAWSVGLLAAVGPVLAIAGRMRTAGAGIIAATGFIGTGISRTSGVVARGLGNLTGMSATTALAVQRNMTRVGSALAGAGIGFAIGSMTKNASTASKAVGALASTAAGGLIGFSAGGPVGAALGAGAGLLSNLATNFLGADDAAKQAASSVDTFTQAILKDNRALGVNTRAVVANDFLKTGVFDQAAKLNIDPRTLTNAGLGQKAAIASVQAILNKNSNVALGITKEGVPTAHITDRARQVLGLGKDVIRLTQSQVDKLKALAGASNKVREQLGLESGAVKKAKHDADVYNRATSVAGKNDTARAKALKAVAAQQKAAGESMKGLTAQVGVHGTSLSATTKTGKADRDGASNIAALGAIATKYQKIAQAQALSGTSATAAARGYRTSIAALRSQATALGFNKTQVDALLGRYKVTPKSIVTTLVAKIDKATASADQLQRVIDSIQQHQVPGLNANSDQGKAVIAALQARIDALRDKTVTITSVVKTVKVGGTNYTDVRYQNGMPVYGKAPANGAILTQFANGGLQKIGRESHIAQIAPAGSWRLWAEDETGGEAYIPLAQSKRARSREIAIETVKRLGGIAMFANGGVQASGSGYTYGGKWYATRSGAENARERDEYNRKHDKAAKPAAGVYRVGKGYGYQGSYYANAKDANAARADSLHQAAAAEKYHSPEQRRQVVTDTTAYRSAIASGDVAGTRSAYATLYNDAKAAGASKKALDALSKSERRIIADLQQRAKVTAQVTKAQEYLADLRSKAADVRTSVKGAFTSSFDITAAAPQMFNDRAAGGTPDGILASITAKADKAEAFGALLKKLGDEGLSTTLLSQLAQAGPTAEAFNAAKALSSATPKQLSSINAQYKRLDVAGAAAGAYVSTAMFGTQIATANALLHGWDPKKNPHMGAAVRKLGASLYGAGKLSGVGLTHGLLGQQKAAGNAAAKLGAQVRDALKKSLGIHSPSRVTRELGRHTGTGFALGLTDVIGHVSSASAALGGAALPTSSGSGHAAGSNGDTYVHHEWHITEADNGMETAHKVIRRLAFAGP